MLPHLRAVLVSLLRRRALAFRLGLVVALVALVVSVSPALAADLGTGTLAVAGTRLTLSPESQTVPFNTATTVATHLEGFDPASGVLPPDLKVVGELRGPEIDGALRLETLPNQPFRIPRFSLEGEYWLEDIRLVQGEELLAYSEPRSSAIRVTQVLVTRITSRALTLDEIRSYGIVADDENFRAFNFTFGFAVDGKTFDYNVTLLEEPSSTGRPPIQILNPTAHLDGRSGTVTGRFRPPRMAPFTLQLENPSRVDRYGGCGAIDGCYGATPRSLPGVILFPTDVSLLNQFFSVVVLAKNGAPEGDPLVIRDLTARITLPPGLRQAETEPPTPLGVPVPVRVPGADGELGTADDITFLVAQAEGQAEVLVEGRKPGTHLVEFDLQGVLDGFPDGEIRRVTGKAQGAVVVRDPTLGLNVTHPETVRTDDEYSLFLTVSNTSNAPVNLVSLTLPVGELSGVQVVGSNSRQIATLPPGDSEVVEFRLLSQRTGRVVATAIRTGSRIDPTFELAVAVGDGDVPLSPDTIILPDVTSHLPADLVRSSLGLVGLGYSLATVPSEELKPDLPQIGLDLLHEKVYWLAQAGRHVRLGEDPFDSMAVLAAEWTGARNPDWEWDLLRRTTQKGAAVGEDLAATFATEAAATSHQAAFERFAATTAFLGPVQAVLAEGNGASVAVRSRTSGSVLSGRGIDPLRSRGLPYADLYDLDGAEMALMAAPEEVGYRVQISDSDGGTTDLHLLVPDSAGDLRVVRWTNLVLGSAGTAEVEYAPGDTTFTLAVDADGDGMAESQVPGAVAFLPPRAFEAVAAVQDPSIVTGHVVEVLFTQDVDLPALLPSDPTRFQLPDNLSNGGLVEVEEDIVVFYTLFEENPFDGLMNTRVVRVTFDNPVSPLKTHSLTVNGVRSVTGETADDSVVSVETTVSDPGVIVQGTVYGSDGQPVPFAKIDLFQTDYYHFRVTNCQRNRVAEVEADAQGRFELDYVRQTTCDDSFQLLATDPTSNRQGKAVGKVRFVGQTQELDVIMLGRGTVRGRVTYEDGTVPDDLQVVGYSPVFSTGYEAAYGPDGTYEVRDLPVGPVSLGAGDRLGSTVYQTVEIPRAGVVVERDLTILRIPVEEPTGDVRGTVFATDGTTPIFDAYVALYVDGELVGIERSAGDGGFDFGTVRTGLAEIEAFDGATGISGAQLFFDIQPDQVNDVTVLLRDDRGTVEGHVYRQSLSTITPAANAVVWVSGTPFNTVTDETGYYRLEGVFAGNRGILAADLENQVQASAEVTINAGGETVYRDLYFSESVEGGLGGEVLGFTGNPVAGAQIHLSTGGDQWFGEYYAGFDGRFTIPNRPPGKYELHAISGGSGAVAQATIRFEGETPFVQIRFKKGTIQGTTRALDPSGQEIGVRSLVTYRTTVVRNGLLGLDYEAHTLETEEDGSFVIPDVLAGSYQLTITNAFHGERTFRDQIVYHGEVRQHDVLFEPNGTVRGTVLDWGGVTPVSGATVHLRHPLVSEYDLVTDEEGRFTFELVAPTNRRFPVDAEIERNGVYRTARVWVGLTKPGQELDVEVVLPMQGIVSGWVEDSVGAPVPGAVVTLREHSYPNRELVHNADQDGSFSFTNVFAGEVSLAAQAPALGGLGGRDAVEIIEEGQEVFGVVVLEATGEIEGTTYSPETGEVVPTAQVTLERWFRGIFDSVTASAGEFRFRLLPLDLYRVRVFDPATGRFGESDWVSVDINAQVLTVDVTLEARGTVEGHLYEPETLLGVPAATVRLTSKAVRPFVTYASTDVDGYFEFGGIPEGPFTLSSQEPNGRRRASGSGEIVEEDEVVTVDLYLEPVGRVVGTVRNPAGIPDGPFANANAILREGWREFSPVVGATLDNPYTFEGVLTGRTLSAWAYENGGDHKGRVLGELEEGQEELVLDVRMVPIGSVAVTVVDGFGAPVAGADVQLRTRGFYAYDTLYSNTGSDGRATFQAVGESFLSATATKPGTLLRGSASAQLTLEGEQVEILVTLEDSGTVSGRVLLSDGVTPAADALVVLTRGTRTLQAQADSNGDFAFEAVPTGDFDVFVQESFGPGTIERGGTIAANGEAVALGTLVLDDHDPEVESIEPATGSADLPLSCVVTVHFTEPIDPSRWHWSWLTFRKVGSTAVAFTQTWSEGDTVLTLTPDAPLESFTAYEVLVKDAYDLAGRELTTWGRTTFNTVDVIPPTVVDVLPRDGASQVPVDASIVVTFSEKVAFGSLSGSAFQLTDLTTSSGVTTTFQQLTGERQVLVTPASGLVANHQYRLTVVGVSDNGGNSMTGPVTTRFWSVDTLPPQITSVTFPEGTSYVAGDSVPVVVEATDEWGVASTGLVIGGWSWTDDTEPWELTGVVPGQASAGSLTVEIQATDVHGNVASTTRTLSVAPNPNAGTPVLDVGCGRDGGYAVPGYAVDLGARASDDEAVESIALFVDDQEIGRASPLNVSLAEASFVWTPPAGAAPGTPYAVRLEARDFAGNVGTTEITVTTPPASATVLPFGTTLFASTYDGTDLVLANGTFLASDALSLASLTVARSARIVNAVGSNAPIELTATGLVDVQCGGRIDASQAGYPRVVGNDLPGIGPAWVAQAEPVGGGSHGGVGTESTSSTSSPGEVYGSLFEPGLGGASGSAGGVGEDRWGGAGGGVVDIEAASLEVDGEILSRGESQLEWGGSGAGGSILVRVDSLAGIGSVEASGGDNEGHPYPFGGAYPADGAGGGGRIALYVETLSPSFDPVRQVRARGGRRFNSWPGEGVLLEYAGPGTVLVKTGSDSFGRLILDNGLADDGTVRDGPATELPALGTGPVTAVETAGADAWVTSGTAFHPRWVGAWMVLLDGSGAEIGSFQVSEVDAPDRALLAGAAGATGAVSYAGEWRFDEIDLLNGADLHASDPISGAEIVLEGDVQTVNELVADNVLVKSGAVVRPITGDRFRFEVSGTLMVESGAMIDVSGLGYPGGANGADGGAPAGLSGSTAFSGGSHGGRGSVGQTAGSTPGEVYDSVYRPSLGGGGGSSVGSVYLEGGAGGGVIEIEAGALVLDGQVLARGETPDGSGEAGGAGGSIVVRAASVSGGGVIDASGAPKGPVCSAQAGSGGGGRISLEVESFSGFDPASQVRAWGGEVFDCEVVDRYAAPGTIYLKKSTDPYGTLVLDAGTEPGGTQRVGPATELPALGNGSVTAFEVSGADAWVTAGSPFRERWAGAWMVLQDGTGGELGAFRVAALDAAGRVLLEGAGSVLGASDYRGEYRFDEIETRNGAGFEAADPVIGTTLTLSGETAVDAEITAPEVVVKSGAIVRPASGGSLRFNVSGRLTVEAGAVIDVTGLGYPGSAPGAVGGAPPELAGATSGAGGSHGGGGSIDEDRAGSLAGAVFDSIYEPSLGGGGGASAAIGDDRGGAGGGAIRIDATSVVLQGELRARGEQPDHTSEAGGGGGTIVVRANALTGNGLIDASGGDGSSGCRSGSGPGGGGGGRIALEVDDLTAFDLAAQVRAWGGGVLECGIEGNYGAAGTLYVKESGDLYGSLILDAGETLESTWRVGVPTELPALGSGPVTSFEIAGSDAWITASAPFRERWLGAWMVLLDGPGGDIGGFRVTSLDESGRALLKGAGTATGASGYRGEYRFDRVEARRGAGLAMTGELHSPILLLSGPVEIAEPLVVPELTLQSGADVRPATGLGSLDLQVTGTLTLEAGASIDVSGLGFPGGDTTDRTGAAPAGVSGSAVDAGGSHGGEGATWNNPGPAGEVYDGVYRPELGGGGGSFVGSSASWSGSAGGGVLRVAAGALVLDGTLVAQGLPGDDYSSTSRGAGAGGTIVVSAGSLSGTGLIDASGGDSDGFNGGGGGGRVLLDVGSLGGFDPPSQVRTWGGGTTDSVGQIHAFAAPGTALVQTATSTYGDLVVSHGGRTGAPAPATVLPEVGKGVVGAVSVDGTDPTDLWIEDQDPQKTFGHGVVGMWVRIDGVDYPVVDQSADRRMLLLNGAAGAVTTGNAYLGIYKFDSVTVTGDAHLSIRDGDDVGTWQVDPGSSLTRLDLDPPAVTVTSPAAGTLFVVGDPVAIAADVTDPSGVASVTFHLEGQSFLDDTAPYEWTTAAPPVAVEQDVEITVDSVDSEGNAGTSTHTIRVRPVAAGDPPVVTVDCPSPGARLAPGTGLDFTVSATHDDGIERIELFVGAETTATAADLDAPYSFHYDVPAAALDGDVVTLRFRARSTGGIEGEISYAIQVVSGQVFTSSTQIAPTNTTYDGQSVVAAAGTLTIQGPHTFRDLVVLDGATVTHPATTTSVEHRLELTLTRDLFIACSGAVDAAGKGYPAGYGYPLSQAEAPAYGVAGSHGGRGGNADGSNPIYGNLFDPRDSGGGANGYNPKKGGGVVRIATVGEAIVDGTIAVTGGDWTTGGHKGAGGSIRLDGAVIRGTGVLDAAGGGASTLSKPAGGGGRIALYGGTVSDSLVDRATARGGDAEDPELRGAAGTIFVKRDSQAFGDLILDNGGLDSAQVTELLGFLPGVLDAVGVSTVTDDQADFHHDLSGIEVFFAGDSTALWEITDHDHHGQMLTLDTSSQALTALSGDSYEGLYRFDRVIVRGGAVGISRVEVESGSPPEVEAGSTWTDGYLPSVALTDPLESQAFTSGTTFTVSAQADDLFGVQEVELSFDGQSVQDTTAPYTTTFVAPLVSAFTDMPVVATLRDRSGHEVAASVTIRIDPNPDGVTPVVSLGDCPRTGDLVVAGAPVSLSFTIVDNEWLESYRVLVDGVVEHEVLAVNQASVDTSYTWTPPAGAAPGTAFTVRVEGRDYAGGIGYDEWVFGIPVGAVLTGNQTLDSTWNGSDLVLTAGTFTVTEPLALNSLSLVSGATLEASVGAGLSLDMVSALRVQCGTLIEMSGQGFAGGDNGHPNGHAPPGLVPSSPDAGGSHGGAGMVVDGAGPAGEVYDSVYWPRLAGGGGALHNTTQTKYQSGAGGGVVEIVAGTVRLDGEIRAEGETRGYYESGGAGGSVLLDVGGALSGSGRIDASGGGCLSTWYAGREGGAGGGRVAIHAGSLMGFDPATQVDVAGGETAYNSTINGYGAAGTILVHTEGVSTYGDLILDAEIDPVATTAEALATELPALGAGTVMAFEPSGGDAWVTAASAFPVRWLGGWMVLEDGSGTPLGTFQVVELDATGRLRLTGAGALSLPATYRGEYRFDTVTLRGGAKLSASDGLEVGSALVEGNAGLPPEAHVLGDLTIKSGSTVSAASGGQVGLEVDGTLIVEAGAAIDVSGQGYAGGVLGHPDGYAPSGLAGSAPDAGGSHGGVGAVYDGSGPAGEVYDSVYRPRLSGSGGALRNTTEANRDGGAGGGVLEIVAGSVVLEGELRARGEDRGTYESAGGGGTVLLEVTGSLSGSGRIDAAGGDSTSTYLYGNEGGGGGGRVALYVASYLGFDPESQVSVQGGESSSSGTIENYGAPGTVLLYSPGVSTYGHLIVDAGTEVGGARRTGPATELPALGAAGVVAFEPAGGDAWLTAAVPFQARWVGTTVVLEDAVGTFLGEFDVTRVDETGRARLLGAGSIVGPATYRGEYRFDAVTLRNGAGLSASDRVLSGSMVVDGAGLPQELYVSGDLTVTSDSVLQPTAGDTIRLEVGGALTIEPGAVLDVSGRGYAGGHSGHPDGYGPAGYVPSSPDAGGSHGGAGHLYDGSGPVGEVYDSVYRPSMAGGGGALRNTTDNRQSGAGGGVVEIVAGSVVLDGDILASGETRATYESGGAGGTVMLEAAGTLSGAGRIVASGGDTSGTASNGVEGAGGGGRVSLHVGSLAGFDPETQVEVRAGRTWFSGIKGFGSPGTLLVSRDGLSTYGDLYVDAGIAYDGSERIGVPTQLPSLGSGDVVGFEVDGPDAWVTGATAFRPRWEGATMVVGDGSGLDLGSFEVAALDLAGRALLAGAGGITPPSSYRGEYRFDAVTLRNGAALASSDRLEAESILVAGTSALPSPVDVLGDVTLTSGSTVGASGGHLLSLEIGGSLTIEAGAALDVSGQGYAGGNSGHPDGYAPLSVVPSSPDAGGSHGGAGAVFDGPGPSGEIYDSVYWPRLAGGGGAWHGSSGTNYVSGAGGGALEVVAGSVVLDGEIRARGESRGLAESSGAGGSVLIDLAGVLSGSGSIDASGGDSTSTASSGREGGGGGGRVVLYVGSLSGFDPSTQISVEGGETSYSSYRYPFGAPGTALVVVEGVSTYGDLYVDAGAALGVGQPNTTLPTPGSGLVGLVEVDATDPGDLWIEPQDAGAYFDVGVSGMWLRVNGADYLVLDQSDDRRRVLLDGAAGLVAVGDAFQGVYKFDLVTVRRGAVLEFLDTAEVTSWDIDADSQVITPQP